MIAGQCRVLVVDADRSLDRELDRIFAAAAIETHRHRDVGSREHAVDHARDADDAVEHLCRANAADEPYSVAFVDAGSPPHIDGLQAAEKLWQEDDHLHIVLCATSPSQELATLALRLGNCDRLFVLNKPLDPVAVRQLSASLCERVRLDGQTRRQIADLTVARAEAEETARTKANFLTNMSHEIRTPMTAILGFAELMREEELPRLQQLDHLATISNSGQYLLRILSDVLDLAKMDADRVEFENVPFNLADSMRHAIAIMRGAASKKGLLLELVSEGDFPAQVVGDPTRLQQILLNLLSNAIKFTAHGFVRLRLVGKRTRSQSLEIQIHVEDSGTGIPADKIPGLFAMFSQADPSIRRRFGGTGLGLVISRRIARAMGGEITVDSEPGKGTCFTVSLTIAVPDGTAWGVLHPDHVKVKGEPLAPKARPRIDARILVADDQRDNQRLLAKYLNLAGAQVTTVDNGAEALELVHSGGDFDLIVTDMHMDGVDGPTLIRKLRTGGCRTPIVVVTANAMAKERQQCVQAGCDDFLTKPIDRQALLVTCARLLAESAAADGAGRLSVRLPQ